MRVIWGNPTLIHPHIRQTPPITLHRNWALWSVSIWSGSPK